ncbi:hypothetical protein EVAR_93180_1 [Eumeta japonica]|uniref:Uncharacterized protein n=1 Tax=Eumeta variegata TaxID=151549 RepID=A0A4C1TGG8_EUMVA|nr:hypothetical protein EVAR_93180_1 [Eumeta japonica]
MLLTAVAATTHNALVTPQRLQVYMVGGDHLHSNDPHAPLLLMTHHAVNHDLGFVPTLDANSETAFVSDSDREIDPAECCGRAIYLLGDLHAFSRPSRDKIAPYLVCGYRLRLSNDLRSGPGGIQRELRFPETTSATPEFLPIAFAVPTRRGFVEMAGVAINHDQGALARGRRRRSMRPPLLYYNQRLAGPPFAHFSGGRAGAGRCARPRPAPAPLSTNINVHNFIPHLPEERPSIGAACSSFCSVEFLTKTGVLLCHYF